MELVALWERKWWYTSWEWWFLIYLTMKPSFCFVSFRFVFHGGSCRLVLWETYFGKWCFIPYYSQSDLVVFPLGACKHLHTVYSIFTTLFFSDSATRFLEARLLSLCIHCRVPGIESLLENTWWVHDAGMNGNLLLPGIVKNILWHI